jgi:hypothetical protein
MDSSIIELPGSLVESVEIDNGTLKVRFSKAYIVKTITGSAERTRWWQSGDLILEGAELETAVPSGPLVCEGGDVAENVYTYRDMIPIPLNSRGQTGCNLRFADTPEPFVARGETIRLELEGTPKYIEHLRPQAPGRHGSDGT